MTGVHAIVLAAGAGRRFGGSKLSSRWGEGVLLDGALDAAVAAPVEAIWVTVGADAAVRDVARRRIPASKLRVVEVADHALGMSASLRAAVAALPSDAAGVMIFLGDMPCIPHAVLAPLVQALLDGAPAAAPFHGGRRGHPVAIGRALFAPLGELEGDRGAAAVLDALGDALGRIESPDEGVLFDVDRPDEL